MPLTPFHWSIVIFGFLAFSSFYIPALVVSSVLMDLEPFYYMFISPNTDGTLHGFFHTYLGATFLALVVGFVLIKFRKEIDWFAEILEIKQTKISEKWIYYSSLFAAYSHIFLDSFMHADLKPFWPLTEYNPFLGLISNFEIYLITGFGLALVGFLFLFRIFGGNKMNNKEFLEEFFMENEKIVFKSGQYIKHRPTPKEYGELYLLGDNFIKCYGEEIKKIENYQQHLTNLKTHSDGDGGHLYCDKFLELFTAVSLARSFKVKLIENINKEPDIMITDAEGKSYTIEVKNYSLTHSKRKILEQRDLFFSDVKKEMDKKLEQWDNTLRIDFLYCDPEKDNKTNLHGAIKNWKNKIPEILELATSTCEKEDSEPIMKWLKLTKCNGCYIRAELIRVKQEKNINKVKQAKLELSESEEDIAKRIQTDFEKKNADIYVIYDQYFSNNLYPNQHSNIKQIGISLLLKQEGASPKGIIFIDPSSNKKEGRIDINFYDIRDKLDITERINKKMDDFINNNGH